MDFFVGLLRGSVGIAVLIVFCYLLSSNRKLIDWPLVLKGLGIQFVLAILVLKVRFIRVIFDVIANFFVKYLNSIEQMIKRQRRQ